MSEERGRLDIKVLKRLPKNCPPFDVIKFFLKPAGQKKIEFYLTPDEALIIANHLIFVAYESLENFKPYAETFGEEARRNYGK